MLGVRTPVFVLIVWHFSIVAALPQNRTNLANGVLAMVNEAIITYQQLNDYIRDYSPSIYRQYRNQPEELHNHLAQLRAEGLEQLINTRLIIDEFKSSGGLIPDRYIEDEIRTRIRDRYGDQVSLTRELQTRGLTKEDYRQQIRDEIVADYMRRRNLSSEKILISPKKIEQFYQTNQVQYEVGEAVRLRIITLQKVDGDDATAKRKLAEEISSKIQGGTEFAEMAKLYSEDSFAKEGGDRKEMLETSALREEFRESASKLPLRTASKTIETPDGLYLLQVEERRSAHLRPLSEVRDEIEKVLILQERSRLQKRWLERLRKKAFIATF